MITGKTLTFLSNLKENNYREWFHENKPDYQQARNEFETLVNNAILIINEFDPSVGTLQAKDCIFRINRDIRFSKDKSPYKTNFGANISKGGRKSEWAGYYIHLEPGNSFIGGGCYMPSTSVLKTIRTEIFEYYEQFISIVESKSFQSTFSSFYDDKLKTAPKGFPKEFEGIKWLRYKSFAVLKSIDDELVTGNNYISVIRETFKTLYSLNDFINKAIEHSAAEA